MAARWHVVPGSASDGLRGVRAESEFAVSRNEPNFGFNMDYDFGSVALLANRQLHFSLAQRETTTAQQRSGVGVALVAHRSRGPG